MSSAQYDQVIRDLDAAGAGSPTGRLHHVASPKEGGWLVIDVWDSAQSLGKFAEVLVPILQKAGVNPVAPLVYPVHSMIAP
ncbi:MAG: hypothetical protein D6724_03625 [Armatimonadetes bacterium]|nr:MAG: hypothetical protein D6724_03625 [Armatimonadota bacterium]